MPNRKKRVPATAFIYAVRSGDAFKVGRTTNVAARLSGLQTGSAKRLELAFVAEVPAGDAAATEKAVHLILEDDRLHGEWFLASEEEVRQAFERATRNDPRRIIVNRRPVKPGRNITSSLKADLAKSYMPPPQDWDYWRRRKPKVYAQMIKKYGFPSHHQDDFVGPITKPIPLHLQKY